MKFSIVTPSFNQGRFIRDCIESVKSQEGVEIEHIVIDACSTDETVPVLKQFSHLHWVSEPDKGQTDAINKGFRKATGEWVMWLNADDYLEPGALAKVQQWIVNHQDAEIVYGDCIFVEESGKPIRRRYEGAFDRSMLLFYGCFIQSTAAFYKRTLIDQGFLLDDKFKVCMDFDYYMRLACAGRHFMHIPEALASFRWHGSNVSSVFSERRGKERLVVQRDAIRRLGWPEWLGSRLVLRLAFRGYMLKRVLRRLRMKGRR